MNKYDDIINLPHHTSKEFPPMSMKNRAAQFAPFAALNGHEDAIKESARYTGEQIELVESISEILNQKISILQSKISEMPEITITYFKPDNGKNGGEYKIITNKLKRIDYYGNNIVLLNEEQISLQTIIDIQSHIFDE